MDTRSFVRSKTFMGIIAALVFLVAIVGSFLGGMAVGFHKARFSYDWGNRYERQFMGHDKRERGEGAEYGRMPMMGRGSMGLFGDGRDFRNGHGAAGEVIGISDDGRILTVKNADNNETTVRIEDATMIRFGRDVLKPGDVKTGDRVVVFGKPGDTGVVQADFMRVFPSNEQK